MRRSAMLGRKLRRDLWHLRGQLAAVALVAACGVAVVVTTRTSYASLLASRASYYRDYRFADVFVSLTRAPESIRPALQAIPGVARAETRIMVGVNLDVPGLDEPATGRLVSIPEVRRPILNDLHLRQGRWLEPGRRDEVLVSEAFATANRLELGATLGAVINGRWQRLTVVGIAISPEFVYEFAEGSLFPDNRRFGILWMSREALGPAFRMEGAFNDAVLELVPGTSEGDVLTQVDAILAAYGGLGAYGRADQVSARFLSDELEQNRVSGTVIPAIFLGIAAFLLHVVLARIVSTEREVIGALKAFGFDNGTVGLHYLQLSLAALAVGGLAGTALGLWFADAVNARYAEFYRFPAFFFRLDATAVAFALLVTLGAACAGAFGAVRRVVRLPPAAAMQPERPPTIRTTRLEQWALWRWFGVPGRMVLRGILRRPWKSLLSVSGIAFATAMLLVGRFLVDSIARMADVQFRQVQQESIAVTFNLPRPSSVRYDLQHLPGVLKAEPFRAVAVRLRAGHRSRRVAVLGLSPDTEMRRLLDRDLGRVPLPPGGLLLTAKLAEVLAVAPGDSLTFEVLEGDRAVHRVLVAGTVDDLIGLSAYMDERALAALLRDAGSYSGAWLRTDPLHEAELNDRLKRLPAVAGVATRRATLASFNATLAESMNLITSILVGFAGSLAVAMIYNTARIALSERGRELASLRVLGFTRGEVAVILLGEQAVFVTLGLAGGLAIGYGLCAFLSDLYQWELFRMPLVVSSQTVAFSMGVVLAAGAVSAGLVRHRLDRLDIVAVLKSRE